MTIDQNRQVQIKQQLGLQAAHLVQSGMLVGLGTGSTAFFFVQGLIERCREENLKIEAVASSVATHKQAIAGGLTMRDMGQIETIDLTIDGADEIDSKNQLIKGAGGALLREKILAAASCELVILVDESKIVSQLGRKGLPIEIIPFGFSATIAHIKKLALAGELRHVGSKPYVTDNGNFIYDIHTPALFDNPQELQQKLLQIPGVVETGFFFDLASSVLIGYFSGRVEKRVCKRVTK